MFVRRLNDEEERALYEAAAEGAALLDALGHPWWLSHGTLLGAWRHRGVIPWDDDLDFAFPRAHVDELQQAAVERGWCFTRLAPFLAKVWRPDAAMHRSQTRPWTWPFVDLCLYDEAWSRIIIEYDYHHSFKAFRSGELLPVRTHPFGPLKLPIPQGTPLLLGTIFPEWHTRPCSGGYCHRFERRYPETSQRATIAELSKRFELFNVQPSAPVIAAGALNHEKPNG